MKRISPPSCEHIEICQCMVGRPTISHRGEYNSAAVGERVVRELRDRETFVYGL
jgi:hypothetical protein